MISSKNCAERILWTVPPIVRALWQRLQEVTPTPLTPTQFGLLTLLGQESGTTTELAQKWGVSTPTMSKMVSLLVEHGWVVRREDPADRRRKLISLTATGHELQSSVYGAVCHSVAGALDGLQVDQRDQIMGALTLLLERLT
jgi:DNA-binding MarR family transcriptional regulator